MIIGITGGIGSGKSTIAQGLAQRGFAVYDCDREAKRIIETDKSVQSAIIDLLGEEAFVNNSPITNHQSPIIYNTAYVAQRVFAEPKLLERLNAIIHPAVLQDFKHWARNQHKPIVALESAILYESGFNEYVDYVLFVDAPKEVRLDRAMQRDTVSAEKIKARMQMQYPELHRKLADFIIDNSKADDKYIEDQLKTALHYLRNR